MANKRNKKKGSTLVIVLAVAIVMMLLGGVIANSVMGNMKSNTNQKEKEDLKYAAEAGLELAKSHFAAGNTTIDTRATGQQDTMDKVLSGGIVDKVDVFMVNENGKNMVKSVAHHVNGQAQEMMMTQYKQNSSQSGTSIFDHSIVAGEKGVKIENNGSLAVLDTTISSGGNFDVINNGSINLKPEQMVSNDMKSIDFQNWGEEEVFIKLKDSTNSTEGISDTDGYNWNSHEFIKMDREGKWSEVKVSKMKMSLNSSYDAANQKWVVGNATVENSNESPAEYLKKLKDQPVISIEIGGLSVGHPMEIVLVNSKRCLLQISKPMTRNRTVLINSGDLDVQNGECSSGTLNMSSSTLCAEKVTIDYGASLTTNYQPSKINAYGFLTDEEETKLNEILSAKLVDWKSNGSESGNNVEFIEGSFSN